MKNTFDRRRFLLSLGAFGILPKSGLALAGEGAAASSALIAAAWRGPNPGDTYYAGVLAANWESKKLEIRYATALPTRPHGLLPEADGGLLVTGVRPGSWLLRCDGNGEVTQQINLEEETSSARLNGHAILSQRGDVIYTTETDSKNGHGKIGVRDSKSLKKLDEWESHGMEPHQLLLDSDGHVVIANGGIPRTVTDKKYDLHRMDSSLVRLDGQSGRLLRQWKLDDPRLSLRHLAWSHSAAAGKTFLGDAMQAEHDDPAKRAAAPVLAVLSAAMTLAMLQEVPSIVLSMTGYHRITAKAAALGAGVNVVTSVVLAMWLGLIGVALGTLITALCVNVGMTIRLACRFHAVRLRDYLWQVVLPPMLPAVGQAAVTWGIRRAVQPVTIGDVLLSAIPGVIVYIAAFYRIGLRADERERIAGRLRRRNR